PSKTQNPTRSTMSLLQELNLQKQKQELRRKAEQMKLAIKRSLIQTHSSHASGSGADEGTGGKPGVPDVSTYGSDDEQNS
ncbi:hypothetical protein Tco_0346979, partial [Tanacetum coccineum]